MATPTIIIGIGSSGMHILENVQRFYYETFKKNKPDHVEYLYIETNKDNKPEVTPLTNEIKRVYISLDDLKQMSQKIKKSGADWVPELAELLSPGLGAGGVRPIGRLGLWGSNNQANNFSNVIKSINSAHKSVTTKTGVKPVVFLTGTLTGGTASGMFIDLAYMIRDIISNIKELYGLFLIPSKPTDIVTNAQYYANTYASLADLEKYNDTSIKYKEKWPTRQVVKEFVEPPFELFQIISQDYIDGSPAISSLSGLYKMAGLFLYLNMIGMKEKRTERLVDSTIGHYGSFALSAIQYPKDQIEEYVSLLLGAELIERWIDPSRYVYNNADSPINTGTIANQTFDKWDSIIKSTFNSLDTIGGLGGKDLVYELETKAVKINKNDINDPAHDYLYSLFSSSSANNYYGQVKSNLNTARSNIIDKIHSINAKIFAETESIAYAKITLQQMIKAIEDNVNYWKSLGISDRTDQWDKLLQEQCDWMLKNRYKSILEHDKVLIDRMLTTFDLMKMHLLLPVLIEVLEDIKKIDDNALQSDSGVKLPRLKQFDEILKELSELVGRKDSETTSLKLRKESIVSDINDTTIPLYRIYPSDSFDKEIESAKNLYQQKTTDKYRTKNDITQEDLWKYLTMKETNFHSEVYHDMILAYRALLTQHMCIKDYDVTNYVETHPNQVHDVAKKGLLGFISLEKTLTHEHFMPRFIAASSENAIKNVIDKLQNKFNLADFENDENDILEISQLQNMMVFYDEKLNFNPLEDLEYIGDMKEVYLNKPDSYEKTNENWLNDRNAYFKNKSEI